MILRFHMNEHIFPLSTAKRSTDVRIDRVRRLVLHVGPHNLTRTKFNAPSSSNLKRINVASRYYSLNLHGGYKKNSVVKINNFKGLKKLEI